MNRKDDIQKAINVLKRGGIILYPTDTIWGIGCDATNEEAVRKIFRIKKRPENKGFIILVDSKDTLEYFFKNLPEGVTEEMSQAECPTTYVLPGTTGVAPFLIRKDGTTGVRMPQDQFCRDLIRLLGRALVSTSANFAGEPPPAHFGEINPALIKQVDYVVRWRQNDWIPSRPSRIIKIMQDGTKEIIRE